jgi:anti-anti-sigma factor
MPASHRLNLPTEIFGGVIVVHTPDELGGDQAENVENFLVALERDNVVVDLDNTESIDGEGLESLLAAQETLRERGGNLKISTTNHANRKILEITRLDEQLEVFDSVVDAVRGFV